MAREDWGIGIIGLGGIAQHHLEGYRRQGLNVVGGMDIDERHAQRAKEQFSLPFVTTDVEALLSRPDVRIVDITVPHRLDLRKPLVEAAAKHGKAIFLQKPLMPRLDEAKVLVDAASGSGVPFMVNQNSIFAPQFLAAGRFMQPTGDPNIGEAYYFQIDNRSWFDPSGHPWFAKSERWVTSDMAIHHFALARHWFGDVESVCAVLTKDRSQAGVIGDTGGSVLLRFRSGVSGLIVNNWSYRGPNAHPHSNEEVIVQGDGGTLTIGEKEVVFVGGPDNREERVSVEGKWFPDAFGNSMAHFVDALDAGRPYLCEAKDNLKTVAIIESAYRSSAEKREVKIEEILHELGLH
jgi:predicted dehydrogenase